MQSLLNPLRKYIALVSISLFIIQIILGPVLGAVLNEWWVGSPNRPNNRIIQYLIVFGGIYLILAAIDFWSKKDFSTKVIDELDARHKLDVLMKDTGRRRTIDFYINGSIESLNKKTCSLTSEQINDLCEQDVKDGLYSVLGPIVDYPQTILDNDAALFTVAAWVPYSKLPDSVHLESELQGNQQLFILKDELKIAAESVEFGLSNSDEVKGLELEWRQAIEAAELNNSLQTRTVLHKGKTCQLITSPIPFVCEADTGQGALLIVTDDLSSLSNDLEGVLLIFNRILANWLSKYEDCNHNKLEHQKKSLSDSATEQFLGGNADIELADVQNDDEFVQSLSTKVTQEYSNN